MEEGLQAYKDRLRESLVKYTRKAFQTLPEMTMPHILDIGCGSGVPTVELAKSTDGEIVAIDTCQTALRRLSSRVRKAGLAARVKVERCSMSDMDFPDESFDIVWAEGSIAAIGFEKGLSEWRRLLRSGGFLVVHDDLADLPEKQRRIRQGGYELVSHFVLSEDVWWNEYYAPLEERLNALRAKHAGDQSKIAALSDDQHEIDAFKQDPKRYRSVFLVMRKSQ